MTALAPALSAALLHFLWQGAAAAIVIAIALTFLRNRSAHARYLVACAGLAAMAALPMVTTVLLLQPPASPPAIGYLFAPTIIPTATPASAPLSIPDLSRIWTLRIWAAGVVVFAVRLALSYLHVARLRGSGSPADPDVLYRAADLAARMNISRRVRILISEMADCPSVIGWFRPVILIPAAVLAGIDADQLEAILAHELAHIRRHDYLVNLLQTAVETLLFYHPAVWWLSRRIRREREFCCDDLASRQSGGAVCYARALARLERLRTAPALTPAVNGDSLLFRIHRLVEERRETAPSKLPAIGALLVAAAGIAANVHWAHAQSPNTAQVVRRAPIYYPESARAKGIVGPVVAEVTLDGAGNVTDARILSGPVELRRSALASVLDWKFAHASSGEVRQVPIDFNKDTSNTYSVAGTLTVGDELNDRLVHLAEERTNLAEGSPTPQTEKEADRLAELRAEIRELEMQLSAERQQLELRENKLNRNPPEPDASQNREIETIEKKIKHLRSLRETAGATYGPNHPTMKEIEKQLEVLERRLQEFFSNQEPNQEPDLQQLSEAERRNTEISRREMSQGARDPEISAGRSFVELGEIQRSRVEAAAIGRRIAQIDVQPGTGEHSRVGLAQLPVRIGETWSDESLTKLRRWVEAQRSPSGKPTYDLTINDGGGIDVSFIFP